MPPVTLDKKSMREYKCAPTDQYVVPPNAQASLYSPIEHFLNPRKLPLVPPKISPPNLHCTPVAGTTLIKLN